MKISRDLRLLFNKIRYLYLKMMLELRELNGTTMAHVYCQNKTSNEPLRTTKIIKSNNEYN